MKRKILKVLPLFIIAIMIVYYPIAKRNVAQSQPQTAATSFMVALVRNDERLLMEIVVPQQRESVSEWLSSHQRFFCPPGLDFPSPIHYLEDTRLISQDVHLRRNFDYGTVINFDAFYQCRIDINSDWGLNFEVDDIVIEQIDDRWFIKSWRFVCESDRLNGCM